MVCVLCVHCNSERLVKDGFGENGKQRYRCRGCGKRSRDNASVPGVPPEKAAQVLAALNERMSLRGAARAFGMSRNTITALLEKKTS